MNIQFGNLALENIVEEKHLKTIRDFLDNNGFKKEMVCRDIENELGNYHIFDIPRQILICGKEKMEEFIKFLQVNNLVADGFKERIGITYCNKK